MSTWNDARNVAFDVETSGSLPEFALQPYRVATGESWVTCWSTAEKLTGKTRLNGGLAPDRGTLEALARECVERKLTVVGWNVAFDAAWLIAYGLEDLVMQINWLDGMLLWRHLDIEPEYDTQRDKKRSYGLKQAVREFLPQYAGYEDEVDFHDPSTEARAKLLAYCKKDTAFALAITKRLYQALEQEPARLKTALIEAKCIPLVASALVRGMCVDMKQTGKLYDDLADVADKCLEALEPHGVTETVVRSPKQLGKLLFEDWGLPVIKQNTSKKTGNISDSTDKEVLHELSFIDPRAKVLRQYREALNNQTKFPNAIIESVRYNGDGKTRPAARIFGTYCVPGDVEVLTREGWVALKDWRGGEIVQATPDLKLQFLPATRFEGPDVDSWIRVDHANLTCDFTGGHTVPFINQQGDWRTIQAHELLTRSSVHIPTAGMIEGLSGGLSPDQMRVLCMCHADAWFNTAKGSVKLTLVRCRKVERAKSLLAAVGITPREYSCSADPQRVEITINKRDVPEWLTVECKHLGAWLFDTSYAGLEAFVAELAYWDGSFRPDGGVKFSSAKALDVEWVCTIAHLVGIRASQHKPYVDRRGHSIYSVHISDPRVRAIRTVYRDRHVTSVQTTQRAYCATTVTGYWLARSKGAIFITGNTGRMTYDSKQGKNKDARQTGFALHQMKRGKDFRSEIVPPEGYTLCEFDAAGQEFRWMAIASRDENMLQLCLPGEDPHGYMGARIANRDYHELLQALHDGDVTAKDSRQLGKVSNLSLAYRTSANKLRSVARVQYNIPMELDQAKMIRRRYLETYPGVPAYWEEQIYTCSRQRYVETFAGRRVQLLDDFNGPMGWQLASTTINYRIQGTGADQKYLALAVLRPYMVKHGIHFAWELHDGLYFYIPDTKVAECVPEIRRMLGTLPYQKAWGFTPPIPLPWDAKTGKSWGHLVEYVEE